MKCCNCGNEMEVKLRPKVSWDDEYEEWDLYHGEYYDCPKCKITFDDAWGDDPEKVKQWYIPDEYLPSEKQKRTVIFIYNRLKLNRNEKEEGYTRYTYWKFINKYFEEAKKIKIERKPDTWGVWDNDWTTDCFGCEFWC